MGIKEVYNTYKDELTRYCINKYKTDYDTTNELIQLSFIKFDKVNNNKITKVFNYLTFVLNSVFIDYYRKKKREKIIFFDTLAYDYIEETDESDLDEKVELLYNCIKKLKNKDQKIIDLFYFKKLKHKDISEILDVNINTCRSMLLRAKKNLKELMQ